MNWKEDYQKRLDKVTEGGKKKMTQVIIFLNEAENKIVNLYKIQNNHVSKQDAIRDIIKKQRVQIDTATDNEPDNTEKDSK